MLNQRNGKEMRTIQPMIERFIANNTAKNLDSQRKNSDVIDNPKRSERKSKILSKYHGKA